MKIYKYISAILITSLFVACTKELPFPDVEDSPLMVINSLFSPQEGITVHVSESCHIVNQDCALNYLSNAEVKLLDENGVLLSVLEHSEDGIYNAREVTIEHGKNYQLEVNDKSSTLKNITCNTSVPMPVKAKLIGLEEAIVGGRTTWALDVEIEDDPDVENYYMLEGTFDIVGGSHSEYVSDINGYIEPHFQHFTDDPNAENSLLFTSIDFTEFGLRAVYLSDRNFNGQKYTTRVGLFDEDLVRHREVIGNIAVKSVSKDMFEYAVSLDEYRLLEANPFADPIQLYTNIEDGVGIFGGFTTTAFSQELPPSELWFDEIIVDNEGCTAPCTVTFTAVGGSKLNYFWDFGDGGTSAERVAKHTYEKSGEYMIEMNATSQNNGHVANFNIEIK